MTVRSVVVGWGAVTKQMLRVLSATDWYETSAVVDVRQEALDEAQATHAGVRTYSDLDKALTFEDADVVIINTPSHLHYNQVKQALHAGSHVLVAKPFTNNFEQACELVVTAEEQGVTLSVGHQMRYMRHYQAVSRCIESGRLGSVEAINFLNSKPRPKPANLSKMDHPALYEMSCHHFDSMAALVPDKQPESISCDGFIPSWSTYVGPSMVNAWIRYTDGLHVLYQSGFSAQAPNYEVRIEGSAGTLRCRGAHMSIDTMTNEFARPGEDFSPTNIDNEIDMVNPWSVFAESWHSYLIGKSEPPFSGRNNLKVFALLSAGIESVEQGGAVVDVLGNPRYTAAFSGASAGQGLAGR